LLICSDPNSIKGYISREIQCKGVSVLPTPANFFCQSFPRSCFLNTIPNDLLFWETWKPKSVHRLTTKSTSSQRRDWSLFGLWSVPIDFAPRAPLIQASESDANPPQRNREPNAPNLDEFWRQAACTRRSKSTTNGGNPAVVS